MLTIFECSEKESRKSRKFCQVGLKIEVERRENTRFTAKNHGQGLPLSFQGKDSFFQGEVTWKRRGVNDT